MNLLKSSKYYNDLIEKIDYIISIQLKREHYIKFTIGELMQFKELIIMYLDILEKENK